MNNSGHRRPSLAAGLAALLAAGLFAAPGCGGGASGGGPTGPAPTVTVTFVYRAATAVDPAVLAAFPACVNGVQPTHIHPGWRNFVRIDLLADGANAWRISFPDVPIGSEQRIRISDPNACARDPNGASTDGVFANGVLLSRVVDTPGNGTEPGLAFTAAADGTVAP